MADEGESSVEVEKSKSSMSYSLLIMICKKCVWQFLVIVRNFRKVFKFAYSLSRRVDVYGMGITFGSVSNSTS
jgi:hypothetical protein